MGSDAWNVKIQSLRAERKRDYLTERDTQKVKIVAK